MTLANNHGSFKRIGNLLRRDANHSISVMGATPEERTPLVRWLGFADEATFWNAHRTRLAETRQIASSLLPPGAQSQHEP